MSDMSSNRTSSKIAHIGPSNFFRGHWLPLLQEVDPTIDVTAISLRSTNARDQLMPNDCIYSVFERRNDRCLKETKIKNLSSIISSKTEDGTHDISGIVDFLSSPDVEVVTLTVTHDAYTRPDNIFFDVTTGNVIDANTREVLDPAVSAVLTAALYRRYQMGYEPFILMSLDNGEELSTKMKLNIQNLASQTGDSSVFFRDWIESSLPVIDTMVDRIVPNFEDFQKSKFLANANFLNSDTVYDPSDETHIFTEPWPMATLVMMQGSPNQTRNPTDHPIFRKLQTHDNVHTSIDGTEFTRLKIRTINGAHFALGMLGTLAGYQTTAQAMKNPSISTFIRNYIASMGESLNGHVPNGFDMESYQTESFERLRNPFIGDRLTRICRDSVTKLDQRLIQPLVDLHNSDKAHSYHDFTLVIWSKYMQLAAEPGSVLRDCEPTALKMGLLNESSEHFNDVSSMFVQDSLEKHFPYHSMYELNRQIKTAESKFDDFMQLVSYGRQNPGVDLSSRVGSMFSVSSMSRPDGSDGGYGVYVAIGSRQLPAL